MTITRIVFASDIHGSERTFLKFINSGKFYKANVLIHGGDLSGKVIIPVVEKTSGVYECDFWSRHWVLKTEEELRNLEKYVRDAGYYPYRTDVEGLKKLKEDKEFLEKIFSEMITERAKLWVSIAEQRLKNTGIKCIINAGNDDDYVIDKVLQESDYITFPEGRVIKVDEKHEMISTGCTNITPWKCARDIEEWVLAEKIEAMVSEVKDMKNAIFNFHCPPYKTLLDQAPVVRKKGDEVQFCGGIGHACCGPESIGAFIAESVGSKAVKDAILKYQPLLGLHGHIHEVKAVQKLHYTTMMSPGSQYLDGVLSSAIIELENKIKNYFFATG
ncbi:MAG: metallophosphoesterase [Candidatus Bathyarchaeota archaeon]